MRKIVTSLLLLLAAIATAEVSKIVLNGSATLAGKTVLSPGYDDGGVFGNSYTDFDIGVTGDTVNMSNLVLSTHGGGGGVWSTNMACPAIQLITNDYQILRPILLQDVGYTDFNNPEHGLSVSNIIDSQYIQYDFPSNVNSCSVGFYWYGQMSAQNNNINPLDITGFGSFASFFFADHDTGITTVDCETDTGDGAGITISSNTWYWVTMQYVRNSTCTLQLWTNGVLVGTSTQAAGDNAVSRVRVGRVDAHPSHPNTLMYFDDLVICWNPARYPVGPHNNTNYWAPTISNIRSNTPGTTNATITWNTDDAVADSRLYYSTDSSYSSNSSGATGTTHSVSITNLSPGTLYNFKVASTSATRSSLSTTSAPSSFTTVSTGTSDTFTRANETPLAAPWAKAGSASPSFNLSGNAVIAGSDSSDTQYYYGGISLGADQYSQATLSMTGTSTDTGPGVGIRLANTGTTMVGYRCVVSKAASSNLRLGKWTAGTYSELTNKTITWTDGQTLKLAAQGTTIDVFTNGVKIISMTDSTTTSTNAGITYSSTCAGNVIDNFQCGAYP